MGNGEKGILIIKIPEEKIKFYRRTELFDHIVFDPIEGHECMFEPDFPYPVKYISIIIFDTGYVEVENNYGFKSEKKRDKALKLAKEWFTKEKCYNICLNDYDTFNICKIIRQNCEKDRSAQETSQC